MYGSHFLQGRWWNNDAGCPERWWSIPGNIQGQAGLGSEQYDVAEDLPSLCRAAGAK